jgi:hypothetical protein
MRIPSILSQSLFGFLVRPAVQFADSVADQQPNSMRKRGTYILASHRTQSNGSDGIDPRRSRHSAQSMRVATSGMTKCYSTITRRASLALCEDFFVRTIPETAVRTYNRPDEQPEDACAQPTDRRNLDHAPAAQVDGRALSKQADRLARVVAEMLLAHVLGCERMKLYMEADRPASTPELTTLRELVARAAKHEPVQHLVGHAWFFGRQFEVNRSTLIPGRAPKRWWSTLSSGIG